MQYENKVLISAILIIGLGVISFNVVNTADISGRSTRDCKPPTLDAERIGNNVYVTVNGDVSSDHRYVYLADERKNRVSNVPMGRDNFDKETFTISFIDYTNDDETYAYAYIISGCDGSSKVYTRIPSI